MTAFFKNIFYSVRRTLRKWVIAIGKRVPTFLRWARETVYSYRRRRYNAMAAHTPIDASLVLFDAYAGRRYACSPRALYQCLVDPARSAAAPIKPVWVLRKPVAYSLRQRGFDVRGLDKGWVPSGPVDMDGVFSARQLEELRRSIIVPYGSPEYYRMFAKAGLWVSNSRIPMYVLPRKGQTFVQTWHGTPLKRLGCDLDPTGSDNALYETDEMHDNYRFEGRRMSRLISPSAFATEKFASIFDLNGAGRTSVIIEEGYPRNDFLSRFTEADIHRIKARLGLPEDKKVILYAPTWRDDQHSSGVGFTYEPEIDFDALQRELGDDHVILFRAHYFIANAFDFSAYEGFVYNVSSIDDINDLYVISDLLITDYSSVFFDYANLRRPMVFYMYDLDHYASQLHGFYLDLEELPGPIVKTTDEVIASIKAAEAPGAQPDPRYEAFCARFTYLDDGHAAERVVKRLVESGALPPAPVVPGDAEAGSAEATAAGTAAMATDTELLDPVPQA